MLKAIRVADLREMPAARAGLCYAMALHAVSFPVGFMRHGQIAPVNIIGLANMTGCKPELSCLLRRDLLRNILYRRAIGTMIPCTARCFKNVLRIGIFKNAEAQQ